jgi:site-specific DNA-methyltransferase (adenine-specific)
MDRENRRAGYSRFGRVSTRLPDGTLKISDKEDNYVIPKFGKRGSVWRYATGHGNTTRDSEIFKHHPAAFPEKLAEDHILSWTNPGDVVLDPMCGSGTTGKMALLNNRRYIGIDVSEEYCDLARNRIAKYHTSRATELPQFP